MTKTIDDVDGELDHLRNRFDQLEETASEKSAPWYRAPSNIVAFLAFAISLLSYYHTEHKTFIVYAANYEA